MSVNEPAIETRELEALRRHGFGVAYRMLGTVSEAEDVAQEALLRLLSQEGPIGKPAAWMTTVVTRLSINVLRSARVRRESYVGPWLPEPLLEDPAPGPASRAELADSLSRALLGLLERLTPVERAAYLLRDGGGKAMAPPEPLFGAALIARFMASVAQVRRALGEFETRLVRVNGQPGRMLRRPGKEQFGEAERLAVEQGLALLKSGDAGAKELPAFMQGARDRAGRGRTTRVVAQHEAELCVWDVLTVDVVGGRIQTVRIVRNPDKLSHL